MAALHAGDAVRYATRTRYPIDFMTLDGSALLAIVAGRALPDAELIGRLEGRYERTNASAASTMFVAVAAGVRSDSEVFLRKQVHYFADNFIRPGQQAERSLPAFSSGL